MESKQNRKPKDSGKTVYIGNLNYKRDQNGIKFLFSEFGKVRSIELITDPKTDQKKGYAFVKMYRSQDALNAIEGLNGKDIDGRTLKVSEAIESREEKDKPESKFKEYLPKKTAPKKNIKPKKIKRGLDSLLNYLKK